MQITLIKPTSNRIAYFLAYGLTGTFLLLLANWGYTHIQWYLGYLGQNGLYAIQLLSFFAALILWLDAWYKVLVVKDLPVTNMLLIFNYVIGIPVGRLRMSAQTRTALLSVLLEFLFIPIMLVVVLSNGRGLLADASHILQGYLIVDFDVIYAMVVAAIFLIDTLVFLFGYTFASKHLDNRIKSVDPTLFGWAIALCTYPPFNDYTARLFPMVQTGNGLFADSLVIVRAIQLVILLCHFCFLAATLSLGAKASNLTSRGVVRRGMYGVVRHPAYTAKLMAWLFTGIIYAFSVQYFVSWLGFVVIYTLRALSEEWHLEETDAEYSKYRQEVKYRFVPGIV